ncbi:hypothetical protein [Zavarzinella formosa]|uniref:hypothetical protein n=1 Tax=Zavarzinella formosa TaxID=360055 RepID=UPI0002E265B0|nr:hypothetical protein [Zavarzinella formosa]
MADSETLKEILFGAKKKAEPETPMEEGDTEGQVDVGPCGWVWVKGCKAIDVERGGSHPTVSFQYVYIGVASEFTPTMFWVEFVGEKTWRLTVEGRNLRSIYDRIQDHCLRKIRQADRDFNEENGKPFVKCIKIDGKSTEKPD